MLENRKYAGIRYNTDKIQMTRIINVSYSTVTELKTYLRSDRSDQSDRKTN